MNSENESLLIDEPDIEKDDTGSEDTEQQTAEESRDPLEGRKDLQKALYTLYLRCCSEDRYPRMMEVKDTQQGCFYWRGLQYWWWSQRDESWNMPNQQHGVQMAPMDIDDMPRFEFVTNIYQAFGLSLIAAIAQAPPRTRWFPEDADVPDDVETAEGFTTLSKIIERWNPIQTQLQDEVYHLWTGGKVGCWTRYIADGDKYGFESVEDLEEEQQGDESDEVFCQQCSFSAPVEEQPVPSECPECGNELTEDNIVPGLPGKVPSSKGAEQIPKGRQVQTIVGALNLKGPTYAREQSDCHYLSFEEEIHYAKIRAAHPDIADKIKAGSMIGDDNGFERNARLAVMQGTHSQMQTGEAVSCLSTYARVWFRPTAFYSEAIKKEEREELLDIFPRGCRVNFAGPEYCESEEQSMDDCWTVTHAMPGDGQHRPALGSSLLSVQDRFNTFTNIAAETYEYGIPITYRAADTWDAEASEEQRSEPGAEVDITLAAGADIRTRIMQIRNDSVSPDMMKHMMDLMGPVAQFLTGAFPALLGAGAAQGAAGDTAAGYKMQMDQALGRCGISYVRLKQFHADIQTLSCNDYRSHATGRAAMPVLGPSGDFESESVDVTALEGEAKAYPEGDENFPELWNQQRAVMKEIMASVYGQTLASDPDNAELIVKLMGIPGLKLPGSDAKKAALKVIGELTEVTTPEQLDLTMPVDPNAPEVSPDLTAMIKNFIDPLDDHAAMGSIGKHWRTTDAGMKCKKTNPTGFANVTAWTQAQLGMVSPPPPPVKPLSESLTTKLEDLPPSAQIQILKQWGIDVSPQDFIEGMLLAKAKNSKPPLAPGQAGPPAKPGVNGGAGAANVA